MGLMTTRADDKSNPQKTAGKAQAEQRPASHPLRLTVLGSGSKGNCAVVSGPEGALLIDAGFSKKETLRRLELAGIDPANIKALIVTHEHSDHIKGLGVVSRGLKVPVYASRGTAGTSGLRRQAPEALTFGNEDELTLAGISVKVFPASHDAADPVGFRFSWTGVDGSRDDIGYLTDSGVLTGAAEEALREMRVLAIEANHDPQMLATGPYPYVLKQRISSATGHLSNTQSAEGLTRLLSDRLESVVAMHLSETNNLHELPVQSLSAALERAGVAARATAAWQGLPVSVG